VDYEWKKQEEKIMVIFFNVEKVRNFLIEAGYVYTLRKKRFRVGNDTAIYGSRFKQKKIGKVHIGHVMKVTEPTNLVPFVNESGIENRALHLYLTRLEVAKKWFELGVKLSGNDLHLYKVIMANRLEARIKKIITHAKKSLQEDLDEFGIVGNGFWESVEKEILEAIKKS